MKIAIIGRTEILFHCVNLLLERHYRIPLIITAEEAPEYTKTSKDFQELAHKIGAKFICSNKLNKYIDDIKDAHCDIAVSLNYSSIIPQNIIDLFRLGILNAHGGDLPRYRGNACQAWAIINGEDKIGLCIHSMIGGEVDSGNIIARSYMNIDLDTKVTECWEWMARQIPVLFLQAIGELQQNPGYILEVQSKDPKNALRCYPRIPEDGKIDWTLSNIEILRLINASNKPYHGAYCLYNNTMLKIWDAKLYEDDECYLSLVGQIAQINSDGSIIVICGRGKLKINTIETNGYIGSPSQIVKSIRIRMQ